MRFQVLISTLSLCIAISAAADQSQGYTQLEGMFEAGTKFDFTTKLGWHSGRCWFPESEVAVGGILIMEARGNNGPAFPSTQKFMVYRNPLPAADRFDNLTDFDRLDLRRQFDLVWNDTQVIADDTQFFELYLTAYLRLRQSADGQYLLTKINNPTTGRYLMCYFFKRVDA